MGPINNLLPDSVFTSTAMGLKFYRYIFFKLYTWSKSLNVDSAPEWSAMFTVCILSVMNILTVLATYGLISRSFVRLQINTWTQKIVFFLAYSVVGYFLFIYNQKYRRIEEEFNNETGIETWKGTLYTWLYIIFSLVLFFSSMYLMALRNRGII